MSRSKINCVCAVAIVILAGSRSARADTPTDYAPVDPALKLERIDSSEDESFLSIRCDGMGRLFVGGREAVFRYDPDDQGGYRPRVELYRFPPHSWVYDLELRGPDLYVLTMNALYVLPEGANKTRGLRAKRLLWGVPAGHVHQCFHGLAWGPQGDLHISMGDPLWYYGDFDRPDHWGYWTFFTPDPNANAGWQRHPYHGVGAVFRMAPDGQRFQTVATGLRNSCGLVFDQQYQLFTNDNDHEGLPHAYVPGRLNHVVPHAWFAWPRGWMPHLTPERSDLLDTMTTALGRAVPVGQSYYDDSFLGEKYRQNLLVARWCTRAVTRYPLQPFGASFQCEEKPLVVGRDLARPVGVAVGRGGRIFMTVSYMANNEGSPIYRSDLAMLTRKDDPPSHPFFAADWPALATDRLIEELERRTNWSERQLILVELIRRGRDASLAAAQRLNAADASADLRGYLLWVAASSLREGPEDRQLIARVREQITREWNGPPSPAALQAWRVFGEYFANDSELAPEFSSRFAALAQPIVRDPDESMIRPVTWQQVQLAALGSLFNREADLPPAVIDVYARSSDRYLRQAATRLMADRVSSDELTRRASSDDRAIRLAAVLAAGFRLTMPQIDQPLSDALPLAPWRNPDEAYIIQYAGDAAPADLRKFGRVGTYTVAEHWRVTQPSADQKRLFELLLSRLDDPDNSVRFQAANFLGTLADPKSEPAVRLVLNKNERDRLLLVDLVNPDRAWVAGPFPDQGKGLEATHGPELGPIDLSAMYQTEGSSVTWKQLARGPRFFNFRDAFGEVGDSSSYAFLRLESPRKQQAMLLVGSDDGIRIWHNGRIVHTNDVSRAALPLQDVIHLELEPGSNDLLFRVRNVAGESGLYIHYRTLDNIPPILPEPASVDSLSERLRHANNSGNVKIEPAFLAVDWSRSFVNGDPKRGERLFSADGLGCAKCHSIRADQPVTGGPSLADAGKRFTIPHLVESVLTPNRMISPVFKATLVTTREGKQISGLVVTDTLEKLELLLPDTKRVTVQKAAVESAILQDVSPMPSGLVKTPEELLDLMAFLLNSSVDRSPRSN